MQLEDNRSWKTADWCLSPVLPHALITMRRRHRSITFLWLHPVTPSLAPSAVFCLPKSCCCHFSLTTLPFTPPHTHSLHLLNCLMYRQTTQSILSQRYKLLYLKDSLFLECYLKKTFNVSDWVNLRFGSLTPWEELGFDRECIAVTNQE